MNEFIVAATTMFILTTLPVVIILEYTRRISRETAFRWWSLNWLAGCLKATAMQMSGEYSPIIKALVVVFLVGAATRIVHELLDQDVSA